MSESISIKKGHYFIESQYRIVSFSAIKADLITIYKPRLATNFNLIISK